MSFTLTYKDLSNPNFLSGVKKLVGSDKWKDPRKAYNLARAGSLLEQELKTFFNLRQKQIIKVKAAKPENNEKPTEADLEKLKLLDEENDKFNEISFTIERHKVDFNDLAEISLTPNEILALEPMLENLPD